MIKEKVIEKTCKEYPNPKYNDAYRLDKVIDLTLAEVEKVIDELDNFAKTKVTEYSEGYSNGWIGALEKLKLRLTGETRT